jgi:hypothetical protein
MLSSDREEDLHRPFFNKFLPGLGALHYDGTELPEPLERLAKLTIWTASTGDLGIDFITSES